MSDRRPGWFERSRSWSTPTHIAFSVAAIATAAAVVGALTAGNDQRSPGPANVPGTSSSTTGQGQVSTDPQPTTTTIPAHLGDGTFEALTVLQGIPIQLEHHGGYDRDLFAIWSDLDNDGCDTREEVLIDEAAGPAQVDPAGCTVLAGDWYSVYDGATITSPTDIDIDHVVSLKEAWDSGAWSWTPERRIAYGNDLTDTRTLAAVSTGSNEAKGDRDPSNWLPDQNVCTFVADWIAVKARWGLTMDDSEWHRLRNLLEGPCLETTIDRWEPAPSLRHTRLGTAAQPGLAPQVESVPA